MKQHTASEMARSRTLHSLASRLSMLADDVASPSSTVSRSDRLIAEAEDIAAGVRGCFRGSR